MTPKCRVAFGLNMGIVLSGTLVGLSYIVRPDMTHYHLEVIGVDWSSLAPGVQTLLLVLMKGTGDAALTASLAIALFLLIPFRRGESWSRWAILLVGLTLLVPMLIGAVYLAFTTGASSPWWLNAGALVILLAGFFLSADLAKGQDSAYGRAPYASHQ
jgi:hypothetical protein